MPLATLLKKASILEGELAIVESVMVRAFSGGDNTGPRPVDHPKVATNDTLVLDGNGVPLTTHTALANASDHGQILQAVADSPRGLGNRGWLHSHSNILFADHGYDSEATRDALRAQCVEPVIDCRGEDH